MQTLASSPAAALQQRWDIFCKVVDNLGDAGVCWRLARQLAVEHGRTVRLWIDDVGALAQLLPGLALDEAVQQCQGVYICCWQADFVWSGTLAEAADVVIEAFACDPPAPYLQAMAARPRPPCWINLEYLSAEAWVSGVHGAASPHPSLPLVKFFFFPGFTPGTGGLLRERDLLRRRAALDPATARQEFLAWLGVQFEQADEQAAPLLTSLFCYDTAPLGALLQAWASDPDPVLCLVPPGKPLAALQQHLHGPGPWQCGAARIVPIPFLPQADFDALLWVCDLNFVRGEDSFVRAQWAGKPLVWQIYAQEDAAHLDKLQAFLDLQLPFLPPAAQGPLVQFWRAWNASGPAGLDMSLAWRALRQALPRLEVGAQAWCGHLAGQADLANQLISFCESQV